MGLSNGPLRIWSSYVADLTRLDAIEDIAGPYEALMKHLDTHQFKGKMQADQSLWLPSVFSGSEDQTMSTDQMIEEELAL